MNANMPKGREMVKWQPFASMPEQFVCIKEMIQEQTKNPSSNFNARCKRKD